MSLSHGGVRRFKVSISHARVPFVCCIGCSHWCVLVGKMQEDPETLLVSTANTYDAAGEHSFLDTQENISKITCQCGQSRPVSLTLVCHCGQHRMADCATQKRAMTVVQDTSLNQWDSRRMWGRQPWLHLTQHDNYLPTWLRDIQTGRVESSQASVCTCAGCSRK